MSRWTCPGEIYRAASTLETREDWMLHAGDQGRLDAARGVQSPSTGRAPSSEELSDSSKAFCCLDEARPHGGGWSALLRATDANGNLLSKYFTAPSKACLIQLGYCGLVRLTHQVNRAPGEDRDGEACAVIGWPGGGSAMRAEPGSQTWGWFLGAEGLSCPGPFSTPCCWQRASRHLVEPWLSASPAPTSQGVGKWPKGPSLEEPRSVQHELQVAREEFLEAVCSPNRSRSWVCLVYGSSSLRELPWPLTLNTVFLVRRGEINSGRGGSVWGSVLRRGLSSSPALGGGRCILCCGTPGLLSRKEMLQLSLKQRNSLPRPFLFLVIDPSCHLKATLFLIS